MKYLLVKVDTNDADYIELLSPIKQESLEKITPLIEAIKSFKPYKVNVEGLNWTHGHNYSFGECLRDDLGEKSPMELYGDIGEDIHELFEDFLPFGENGFHSIKSIRILEVSEDIKLL